MKNLDFILAEMSQWKCTRQRITQICVSVKPLTAKWVEEAKRKALALVWTAEDESLNSGKQC